MCDQCADPEGFAEWTRRLLEIIETCGFAVQAIEAGGGHPAWAYTAGLTAHGFPELVLTGLPQRESAAVLGTLAESLLAGSMLTSGATMALRQEYELEFVALAHPAAHLHTATMIFGKNICALQAVWADERGRWPWDRTFRMGAGGQPVLGPRTSVAA